MWQFLTFLNMVKKKRRKFKISLNYVESFRIENDQVLQYRAKVKLQMEPNFEVVFM